MNKSFIKRAIKEIDIFFLLICIALSVFGTIMVASTTYAGSDTFFSRDMLVMLGASTVGIILAIGISFLDYDIILKFWPVLAGGSVFLMLLLFPFGVAPSARSDAISWLKFGGLYLQPSEILKIGFVISFTFHLNKVKRELSSVKNVIFLLAHAMVPIGLVVLTGDMGSALIFVIMFVGMMFMAGLKWYYFPLGVLGVGVAAPILWYKVFDNIQRSRILALFNPDEYSTEMYQQRQAQNGMKAGGFFGSGLGKGAFTQSGSIPESQNDMIFASICEELGFIGALVLILLFVLLAIKIVRVGKKANNFTASMICNGIMLMIVAQVIVNIGMCSSLLPVIGITLPFISAGGSSVFCLYLSVGLVLSVARASSSIDYVDYQYQRIVKTV